MPAVSIVPRHPLFRFHVDHIGDEREPVLIVDDFLNHAETLIDYVAMQARFNRADANYPGVRACAPDAYLHSFRAHLEPLLYQVFGLQSGEISGAQADFSMVVTPPEQLRPLQRIPHYDSNNRNELAGVHFLCGAEQGGTAFYRHRSTGFESVDHTRVTAYKSQLESDVQCSCMPEPAYICGDTPLFEQIAGYDAAFNRLLLYRCTSLHSGRIAPDFAFNPDPRRGRLTLNTFIYCY